MMRHLTEGVSGKGKAVRRPKMLACPSPESFKEAFEGEAEYGPLVTLSNHLGGCWLGGFGKTPL